MATLKVIKEFDSGMNFVLGYVCQYPSGEYWFNPQVSGKRSSRKRWNDPMSSIPRWAKKECTKIEAI